MIALPETVYILIEGNPFLPAAKAYREAEIEFRRAWAEFGRSMGATGVPACFVGSRPSGLVFDKDRPAGWLTPAKGSNTSRPSKRNDAARKIMADLPTRPRPDKVFGDSMTAEVVSEGPHGRQYHGFIGLLVEGPLVGWVGDNFFALIPHAGNAAANAKAKSPDIMITNGADKWTVPLGLIEVSKAEIDLLIAEHAAAAERASRASLSPTLTGGRPA